MRNRHIADTIKIVGIWVLIAFFLSGCPLRQAGINLDSEEKKYLAARTELNLLLEQYIMLQDKISDADHAIAKKAFGAADDALDFWESRLGKGYDYTKDFTVWLDAKRKIFKIIGDLR